MPKPQRKPATRLAAEGLTRPAERPVPSRRAESLHSITSALPLEVARQAQREMDRLRRLPPGTPEAAQVRVYLHWLWSLPWDVTSSEDADLLEVEEVLNRQHLGLPKAKERILEYLSVRRLKDDLPGPALCLVGPPGTGKSSMGAAVARALRRPFVRISVSGTTHVEDLIGISRNVPGGQPGKLLRALREAGTRNPVLMIDGVDRLHYLGLPVDLSHAILLLCANSIDFVPDPLEEHLDVIEVPGYSEEEKLEIARRFLLPRQLAAHGLTSRDLTVSQAALREIVRHYTLEAGVRGLQRQLATLCRKVARARAIGNQARHAVGPQSLERYLGHRLYAHETLDKEDEVGVANGLAWTAAGGEILFVEALKMPGSGRVLTTGQLGEVMKESVQAAHSYVRSRADMLEIEAEAFSNYDIHIHFPAAGVPKDGPSAGITVGLVIASVLSDKPIRHDVAMTGEVSLRGKVLAVGGLREKAIAAYRAGIRALLFPTVNIKDVGDIPEDVRTHLELVPVANMDEVFAAALHKVIVPQRVAGNFVIEVEDDEEPEVEVDGSDLGRAARGTRKP
ncbi:MAG: AAA family ATPase [Candidatus Eisenbacteria bacterium]|uniref:endopeptidase La n=1 Tax=Eiseniibacteriota bacterium TaxID=2212470 RepID=A0A538U752_UNCEI|nr:MAG: AAA family ATPase [Candidatus Eisenbacteria bacterium]